MSYSDGACLSCPAVLWRGSTVLAAVPCATCPANLWVYQEKTYLFTIFTKLVNIFCVPTVLCNPYYSLQILRRCKMMQNDLHKCGSGSINNKVVFFFLHPSTKEPSCLLEPKMAGLGSWFPEKIRSIRMSLGCCVTSHVEIEFSHLFVNECRCYFCGHEWCRNHV